MVNNIIKYKESFDKIVALLSISGYYLKGYIDDHYNKQDSYQIHPRFDDSKPIGTIYRNHKIEVLLDSYKENIIKSISRTDLVSYTKNRRTIKRRNPGNNEKNEDKNNDDLFPD